MDAVRYSRHKHAAHYASTHPAKGHDIEVWLVPVTGQMRFTVRGTPAIRPEGVPSDAEYDCGELLDGVLCHRYTRRAPLSEHPGCVICGGDR